MPTLAPEYTVHWVRGLDALPVRTFHNIARLRQEVFVVEQDCVYLDLDGRDMEPATEQFWVSWDATLSTAPGSAVAADSSAPVVAATLRVLDEGEREPGLRAIGRVVTSPDHRGKALAAALMEAVLAAHGDEPLVLEAQSHLTGWYGKFGFEIAGDEYLEDGIPHTPMRRA
ncbi:GNAT family N-acetyltransferase [Leucobacter aridicollis]|uniref:GNAT family N-acetyltransferase n=1 Tax=Leucobacter aridicollis TaxID=283878 RepID=UPI00210407DB|nr:GNAT family N-acetyltransferase [Leucobacter aridicollis]UTX53130.1 GNAT family N-acetyltransferase [Leucobacter aridicollis]